MISKIIKCIVSILKLNIYKITILIFATIMSSAFISVSYASNDNITIENSTVINEENVKNIDSSSTSNSSNYVTGDGDIFDSLISELKPYLDIDIDETVSSSNETTDGNLENKSNIPVIGEFVDEVTNFPMKFWKALEKFVSKSLKEIFDIAAENSTIVTE